MDPAVGFAELQPLVNGFTNLPSCTYALLYLDVYDCGLGSIRAIHMLETCHGQMLQQLAFWQR